MGRVRLRHMILDGAVQVTSRNISGGPYIEWIHSDK